MLANHFGTDHDRIHQELCDFERSIHHAKMFFEFIILKTGRSYEIHGHLWKNVVHLALVNFYQMDCTLSQMTVQFLKIHSFNPPIKGTLVSDSPNFRSHSS